MKEKDLEDIICRYPELIEKGLTLIGRQIHVDGKFVDLFFQDRFSDKLVVELKKGTIKRDHLNQVLDYEGYFISPNDTVRTMLVGNNVPNNIRKMFDYHGIEWKELSIPYLIKFLEAKKDSDFLQCLFEEESEFNLNTRKRAPEIKQSHQPSRCHKKEIKWTQEEFFKNLQMKTNNETVLVAKEILSWAKSNSLEVIGGEGKARATLQPTFNANPLFRMDDLGKILISFKTNKPPLQNDNEKDELFRRITSLKCVHWEHKIRETWGSINIGDLTDECLCEFLRIFEWVLIKLGK